MTDRRDLVNVQLKVHKSFNSYPVNPRDYSVVLLGPVAEQNHIGTEKPKPCMPSVFDVWMKDIWVKKNAAIFFKFGVTRHGTSEITELEFIEAHKALIGAGPVIIECKYNEQEIAIVQVHDRLVGGQNFNSLTKIPDLPQLPETLNDVGLESNDTMAAIIQDITHCQSDNDCTPMNETVLAGTTEIPSGRLTVINRMINTSHGKGKRLLKGLTKHIVPVGVMAAACGLAVFTFMKWKK